MAELTSEENTAGLIAVKEETLLVEAELRALITDLSRRRKIEFERADDYGRRGFSLTFYYDEINTDALGGADRIRELVARHAALRKRQKIHETRRNEETANRAELARSMRGQV